MQRQQGRHQIVARARLRDRAARRARLRERGEDPREPGAVKTEQRGGQFPRGVAGRAVGARLDGLDQPLDPRDLVLEIHVGGRARAPSRRGGVAR